MKVGCRGTFSQGVDWNKFSDGARKGKVGRTLVTRARVEKNNWACYWIPLYLAYTGYYQVCYISEYEWATFVKW